MEYMIVKKTDDTNAVKDAIHCSTCKLSGTSATVHCLECKEHLCQMCHASHQAFKALKDHKIISIRNFHSGVFSLISENEENQHCEEHDGELKRFYCETCVKLICRDCVVVKKCCRDHQYVTLSEAAKKQTVKLDRLLEKSREKAKECENAIEKTKVVEKDFTLAVESCKTSMTNLREEYADMMKLIFSKHEVDLKAKEAVKVKELNQIKNGLLVKVDEIQSAIDLGTRVTQMGTDFEIATRFTTLSHDLQKVIASQPVAADSSLGQMEITIPIVSFQSEKPWKYAGKFITKQRVYSPYAITMNPDGDIAITSLRYVQVFSRRGSLLSSIRSNPSQQIAATQDNKYILSFPEGITCYDFTKKHKSIINIHDDSNRSISPVSLAVDADDKIIVASGHNKGPSSWFGLITSMIITPSVQVPKITIHQQNGSFVNSFTVDAMPRYIAVTANQDIIVSLDNDIVQMIDYTGNNIRSLEPPSDAEKWVPQNVCCTKKFLFIVNSGVPSAVHKYTISGIYLGIVVSLDGFMTPLDIVVSSDGCEIFIVNRKAGLIQIYQPNI